MPQPLEKLGYLSVCPVIRVARRAGLDVGNGIPFSNKAVARVFFIYIVNNKHQFKQNYTSIFVGLALNDAGYVMER